MVPDVNVQAQWKTTQPASSGRSIERGNAFKVPSQRATIADNQALARLLHRIAHRDKTAFAQLYKRTKRKLFLTAFMILNRQDLAEDAIQEAYVRIWENAVFYDQALGLPMNWMIVIVRNLAISTLRRQGREVHCDESVMLNLPLEARNALEMIEVAQAAQTAKAALQRLAPAKRLLVSQAFLHDESRQQLALRFGVPVNTIKTWIRRTLLELRADLASHNL